MNDSNQTSAEQTRYNSFESKPFFVTASVQSAIDHYLQNPPTESSLSKDCRTVLRMMRSEPASWDERCQTNIEYIGDQFESILRTRESETDISISIYRFAREYEISIPIRKSLTLEFRNILSRLLNDLTPRIPKVDLEYATISMPLDIMRHKVERIENWANKNKTMLDIRSLVDAASSAESTIKNWDNLIEDKRSQVSALKKSLDEQLTGYNFLGISSGFTSLYLRRTRDLLILRILLIVMGLFALAIPVGVLLFRTTPDFSVDVTSAMTLTLFMHLTPILAVELLIVYYIRVALQEYRTIQIQVYQLDLRRSLCQFIENYAEYAKKISEDNPQALDRFEELIFSELFSDSSETLGALDGFEKLARLVDSVRKPSG